MPLIEQGRAAAALMRALGVTDTTRVRRVTLNIEAGQLATLVVERFVDSAATQDIERLQLRAELPPEGVAALPDGGPEAAAASSVPEAVLPLVKTKYGVGVGVNRAEVEAAMARCGFRTQVPVQVYDWPELEAMTPEDIARVRRFWHGASAAGQAAAPGTTAAPEGRSDAVSAPLTTAAAAPQMPWRRALGWLASLWSRRPG
jgi:hypothetical protein